MKSSRRSAQAAWATLRRLAGVNGASRSEAKWDPAAEILSEAKDPDADERYKTGPI